MSGSWSNSALLRALLKRKPSRAGRPNRAESYGKELDFRPIFPFNMCMTMIHPSEDEFCGINAGNHGGHVGFPVLWSGPRPSFPQ
jgi:hypothetical protein